MPRPSNAPESPSQPCLEYHPVRGAPSRQIIVTELPFRLGRSANAHFVLHAPQVSKDHVEIVKVDAQFRIRDLNSTNGTFLNGERITDAPLVSDDIIQLANEEFRFVLLPPETGEEPDGTSTELAAGRVQTSFIRSSQHLKELLTFQNVRMLFQPIVHLDSQRQMLGYEALARGTHSELSVKPLELFRIASQCGLAPTLSLLCRDAAVTESVLLPDGEYLFLNLHPSELSGEALFASLADLQKGIIGGRRIVLEINEHLVADLMTLQILRDRLRELGILVAYDDFGAGQARFLELTEVPPDFIKLDMQLIRGIDFAESRRGLVEAINRASASLGVQIIAEGIETAAEAEVCRELGCQFGQGYLFGPPQGAAVLVNRRQDTRRLDSSQLRSLIKSSSASDPSKQTHIL